MGSIDEKQREEIGLWVKFVNESFSSSVILLLLGEHVKTQPNPQEYLNSFFLNFRKAMEENASQFGVVDHLAMDRYCAVVESQIEHFKTAFHDIFTNKNSTVG